MIRLDYTLIDLERERDIQMIESFVELHDTYLHWKSRYYCDIPIMPGDLAAGWHNKMKSYESWILRPQVMAVGISYLFLSNIWQVFIDASGMAGTIELFFKREKEGQAFADKILHWILTPPAI